MLVPTIEWKYTDGSISSNAAVLTIQFDEKMPTYVEDPMSIATPHIDRVIQTQLFADVNAPTLLEQENERLLWRMLGRMIISRRDNDTTFLALYGPGLGKSLLASLVRSLNPYAIVIDGQPTRACPWMLGMAGAGVMVIAQGVEGICKHEACTHAVSFHFNTRVMHPDLTLESNVMSERAAFLCKASEVCEYADLCEGLQAQS